MRLAQLVQSAERPSSLVEVRAASVVPLTDEPLEELLRRGDSVTSASDDEVPASGEIEADELRFGPPLRPPKLVAIGANYHDHIRESGAEVPETPIVFAKFPSSVIGPDEPIVIDPSLHERVDWEVELGVVIGRRLRNVSEAEALDGVFGYTVGNDISARDVQFADGQWVRAKSFDTFCPLGPVVVTADEIEDPQALRLQTRVNGETMQDATTAEMVFGVAELISFCSRSFTLEPGDLILTGTPHGCGEFMTPVRSLQPGDLVEVEVEGIGVLRNPVIAAESEG